MKKRNESTEISQELRQMALHASRILRDKASLSDIELRDFALRAKRMHRDELANAAEDLLAYRNAAKELEGDRPCGSFTGVVSDFDESRVMNEFSDEWKKAHPELTCDRCGFTSRQEDYFSIADNGDIVCYSCATMNEARKPMNRKRRINENSMWKRIDESRNLCRKHELDMYDEGWLGDKMKAGWEKVKTGAKKVSKAIGDAFKGPFRKGDHIVMKGEDGEEFKGTIKSFDRGDKTYEVLLGNAVNEDWDGRGLQEDVLEMGDRVDELESEIERLWKRLGDIGDKDEVVLDLISRYVELEKIEPGRVDFEESTLVNEETREERAYLRSIGEYDGYLGKKKSARKPIRRPAAKKEYKYSFSASGYGTKTYSFSSEEECLKEMKQDAEATAAEYNGDVQWWDEKECVVVDEDGQELGTFEYLGVSR